ncbi:hypothetical protein QP426_01850 [Pauljensenia sp. UMB1235]|uniref:hypothetical protein n=1 Tax=unclassified Pauljensenia TaxID=2908895 RepID=UPI00254AA4BC|nr:MULTISPECIES: hypothetical protein [unclassified Pauljensenia]MDK6399926.1 hypothetical protein [Pauljensenia sp. UMB9872]MDK7172417.1 hypothetical protein [Pauljensenia sp. UMB1235]
MTNLSDGSGASVTPPQNRSLGNDDARQATNSGQNIQSETVSIEELEREIVRLKERDVVLRTRLSGPEFL